MQSISTGIPIRVFDQTTGLETTYDTMTLAAEAVGLSISAISRNVSRNSTASRYTTYNFKLASDTTPFEFNGFEVYNTITGDTTIIQHLTKAFRLQGTSKIPQMSASAIGTGIIYVNSYIRKNIGTIDGKRHAWPSSMPRIKVPR